MDLSELKYKISKLAFFIGSFKYRRNRNLYISFFLIAVLISSAAFGIYLYQKNVIATKENILKSYFAELTGENPGNNAGSNNNADSGKNSPAASGNTYAENNAGKTGANTNQGPTDNTGTIADKSFADGTDGNGDGNNQPGTDTSGSNPGSQPTTGETAVKIEAYICGYVKNPGVYELKSDARIEQLLEACGGASENACLEAVNLAKMLSDGEMVYIPSVEEVSKNGSFFDYFRGLTQDNISDGGSGSSQSKIVNINTASAGELESLPGIGETIAKDIIVYREKYGLFKSKEELKNVKGIGDIKFEKVKELISI